MVLLSLRAISILKKALQGRAEFPKDRKARAKFLGLRILSFQTLRRRKLGSGTGKGSSQFNLQNIGKKKHVGHVQDTETFP